MTRDWVNVDFAEAEAAVAEVLSEGGITEAYRELGTHLVSGVEGDLYLKEREAKRILGKLYFSAFDAGYKKSLQRVPLVADQGQEPSPYPPPDGRTEKQRRLQPLAIKSGLTEDELRSCHIIFRAAHDNVCPKCGWHRGNMEHLNGTAFRCEECDFELTQEDVVAIQEATPKVLQKRLADFYRVRKALLGKDVGGVDHEYAAALRADAERLVQALKDKKFDTPEARAQEAVKVRDNLEKINALALRRTSEDHEDVKAIVALCNDVLAMIVPPPEESADIRKRAEKFWEEEQARQAESRNDNALIEAQATLTAFQEEMEQVPPDPDHPDVQPLNGLIKAVLDAIVFPTHTYNSVPWDKAPPERRDHVRMTHRDMARGPLAAAIAVRMAPDRVRVGVLVEGRESSVPLGLEEAKVFAEKIVKLADKTWDV